MSSIYCDRVYGEHPIGLWSFSDHLTYMTLLTEADEDVSSWSGGATSYAAFIKDRTPTFPGIGGAYKVTGATSTQVVDTVTEYYVETKKLDLIIPSEISIGDNIDVGFWGFHSGLFSLFEVALIDDTGEVAVMNPSADLIDQITYSESRIVTPSDMWEPVYATFPGPKSIDDVQDLGVRIRAYYPSAGTYSFLIGGISVGQGRGSKIILEDGMSSFPAPKSSGLQHFAGVDQLVGIPEYGFGRDTAYVHKHENRLLASNTGIPMVYGDNTSTYLIPSPHPSLFIPGKGFLHDTGKNSELTLEMWVRLDFTDDSSGKIVGPLWSTDGIYMDNGTLVMAIGSQIVAYEMSGSDGPLLLNIASTPQRVTFMVNAVEVGSVVPATKYPDSYNFNTDWLGVYAYDNISVEIGPVAIYPYVVSPVLAKRRFVWGQGLLTLTNSDYLTFTRTYAKYGMVHKLDFSLIDERDIESHSIIPTTIPFLIG